MKTFDEIEGMILEHIKDIDNSLKKDGQYTEPRMRLFQAKSTALLALAELKGGKDG